VRETVKLACRLGGAGVTFFPSRLNPHDPFTLVSPPSSSNARNERSKHLRVAQFCCDWPWRVISLAGKPRRVFQSLQGSLGTGAVVWGGAVALCDELGSRGASRMRVVELGAGQGLGSLCSLLLGARTVVATDLVPATEAAAVREGEEQTGAGTVVEMGAALAGGGEEGARGGGSSLLDLIAKNMATNAHAFPHNTDTAHQEAAGLGKRWHVAPLVWGDAVQTERVLGLAGGACDLVLASECAYDELCFGDLLATLKALSSEPSPPPRTPPGRGDSPTESGSSARSGDSCVGLSATEVLLSHYPRTQAGGAQPELRAFERQAREAGFAIARFCSFAASTGVEYELHSMRMKWT